MAEFGTEGWEELERAFLRQEENAVDTINEMLEETSEIYVEELKTSAEGYGMKDTGGFINSIQKGKMVVEETSRSIEIVPTGKANHTSDYSGGVSNKRSGSSQNGNVRYAAIGYIYEYGSSSIPAKPWHTKGNVMAESKAKDKAESIWNKYVEESFNGT